MSIEHGKPLIELIDLVVDEASPVDKGDNLGANILVIKSHGGTGIMARIKALWTKVTKGYADEVGMGVMPRTTAQIVAYQHFQEEFCLLKSAFIQSIYSIMNSAPAESMNDMLKTTVEEFSSGSSALAKEAGFTKSAELSKCLEKMVEASGDTEKRDALMEAIEELDSFGIQKDSPATIQGDGATDKEQGMSTQIKPITLEDAFKGMDPAVKAVIEAELAKGKEKQEAEKSAKASEQSELIKRVEAAEKVAKDAADRASKLEESNRDEMFLAKAKNFLVPGQTFQEVAKSLKDAYAIGAGVGDSLEKSYMGLTEHIKKNKALFAAIGKAGGTIVNGQLSAHAQLVELAKGLQKAEPTMTKEQAYVRAGHLNPGLYRAAIRKEEAQG